jgi:hypothetical protein
VKVAFAAVLTVAFGSPWFGFPAPASAATAVMPDREADGAVVVTALTDRERGVGAGTIVAVSGANVRIVTAKHVATFGLLSVQIADEVVPAHIVSFVPGEDVAVIEATVDPERAARLHVAALGVPRAHEAVHIWGSGVDGPAYEPGAIARPGAPLPDGPAQGRYALACSLCHRGDSGGGVFDASGALVGVYVGYFEYATGTRVSVATVPADAVRTALSVPFTDAAIASNDADASAGPASKIARSTTSITPPTMLASTGDRVTKALRNVASISDASAVAVGTGSSAEIVFAAISASR